MTKTKWYQKPLYTLVALALVVSLSLVPAVPVGAVGETFDLDGKTFESDYGPDRGYVAYIQPYDATNLYHSLPGQAIEQYGDPGDAPLGPWDQGDWFKFEYGKPFGGGERQAWAGQNYVVTYWWGCASGYFPKNGLGGDIYIYQPEDGVRPMGILYQGEWRMFDAGTNGLSDVRGDDFWWDLSDAGVAEGDTIEALAWWSNALGWPGLLIEKLIGKGPPKVKEQYPGPDALDMNGDGSTEPLTFVGGGNPSSWHDPFYMGIKYGTPVVCPSQVWVDDGYSMGGDNDGHTWCYDAFDKIQDGIDAVAGSTVHVAAGTYNPTSTIVINKDNLILEGPQAGIDPRPSMGSTRIPGDTSTEAIIDGGGMYRIIKIEANDVIVDGVVVRNGTGDLIRQSDSYSGTTVRNTIVHDALDDEGIQLANATGGLIEHNYVFDVAQDGLNFADSTDSEILNNEVAGSNSENGAIFVYDSENITISGNYVHDTTANNGIKLYTNTGDITVRNNLIVNNSWKIKSKHRDYSGNGILGYKATAAGSTLTIEHNTISNNAVHSESPYHSGDADFGNGIGLNSIPSYDSQVNIINNIVSFNGGWGVITKAYYEHWGQAPTNVFIDCNDVFGNGAGTFSNSGVTYSTYTLGSNNIYVDPQFNPDYTLQAGSPCIGAACDGEDMGVIFPPRLVPMASFVVDHAKLDFKKKPDDDKVHVRGTLELDLVNGDGVDISEDVIVTVGPLSETIKMEEKEKKGEKWEYKRPKDGIGNIKHMTIDWKNGKFDIRMDKADLSEMTDPENVTISVQIGDDVGEETIQMREKKHHWDYKAPRH